MTKPPFLALSCIGFLASAPAFAADPVAATPKTGVAADPQAQDARREGERDDIIVNGKGQVAPAVVESPKATSALIDTQAGEQGKGHGINNPHR